MKEKGFKSRNNRNLSPRLYRPFDKIYKMIWEFHKADVDPFPSVPHGHSIDGRYKLKLWSGEVFDIQTNKQVGKASKKEMLKLYHNNKFQDFVNAAREWFEQNNPYIPELAIPEGRIASGRSAIWKVIRRTNKIDDYKVVLRVKLQQTEVDS